MLHECWIANIDTNSSPWKAKTIMKFLDTAMNGSPRLTIKKSCTPILNQNSLKKMKKKSNSSVHRNPYPLPLLLTKPKDMNTDNRKAHPRRSNSNNRVNCKWKLSDPWLSSSFYEVTSIHKSTPLKLTCVGHFQEYQYSTP